MVTNSNTDSHEIVQLVLDAAQAKQNQDIEKAKTLIDKAIRLAERSGAKNPNLRVLREALLTQFSTNLEEVNWANLEAAYADAFTIYAQQKNIPMQIDTLIHSSRLSYHAGKLQDAEMHLNEAEKLLDSTSPDILAEKLPPLSMSGAAFFQMRREWIAQIRKLIS